MKILMYIIPFKNSIEISLNKIAEKKKGESERIVSILVVNDRGESRDTRDR